jgi:hypothetical protein
MLTLIGAHLGSLEHDLDAIAARLDRYPNFNVEVAARTRNLVRHPSEKVRASFNVARPRRHLFPGHFRLSRRYAHVVLR